jgi:hypothetical protein
MAMIGLSTQVIAATKDQACLSLGKYAGKAAELRDMKVPEDEVRALVSSKNKDIFHSVISYVYTMNGPAEDMRKLVYLKCLANDFHLPRD